jgi:23S rRNA pseudouridine2605 synthase
MSDVRQDLLRRALFALEHPVEKMKRVKVGPLELDDLEEGRYRRLEPNEIAKLRKFVERAEASAPPPRMGRTGGRIRRRRGIKLKLRPPVK